MLEDLESTALAMQGSESLQLDDDVELDNNSLLSTWFEKNPKYQKLLHAPILVSTIDHLIPATESLRGGYHQCMVADNQQPPIVCAWFDEFLTQSIFTHNHDDFIRQHKNFVDKRINKLAEDNAPTRKAKIVPIIKPMIEPILSKQTALDLLTLTIHKTIFSAHTNHHQSNGKYDISFGVVRFANINPLVAVTQALIKHNNHDDCCVHYCVYHSQFTLAKRSMIEEKLDRLVNRKQPNTIWQQSEIIETIKRQPNSKNHIFVVLATSVCEVGRDHDYDWAIAEPSSMRSLIQLAGRLQRHRKQPVNDENLFILDKNYKMLKGNRIVYEKPGFESQKYHLDGNKSITHTLKTEQYQHINSIPSIQLIRPSQPPYDNLVALEQSAYWYKLVGDWQKGQPFEPNNAKIWWNQKVTWTGEVQRQQPFRLSSPEKTFILAPNSQGNLTWLIRDDSNYPYIKLIESQHILNYNEIKFSKDNFSWFNTDEKTRYQQIAERLGVEVEKIPNIYGEVTVPYHKNSNKQYYYHPFLGIFSELE
ncbi:hypothetical protein B0682_02585 [Moraxella lincolnii]|uniref:Beta/gamma crystallin 'Greek key' domain-containing protein n=1 Tax=Lwoffella lincolnii TaxID=90241 RepID=A0A1T0CGU8_9GAMM|nr:hypothetical protein [Moraxella lincolnii]OOS21586.1 hypothetical protein B0682_02585 [Moraxella lincolnii]